VIRPASSKEAIHDAPEVVGPWLTDQRPGSPYSMDETVVSGFQPLEFDEKGDPVPRRVSELPPEKAPKTCGIPRRYLFGVIILVFVALVALGLGLGLGLGMKKKGKDTCVYPWLLSVASLTLHSAALEQVVLILTVWIIQNIVSAARLDHHTTPPMAPSMALVLPWRPSSGTMKSSR